MGQIIINGLMNGFVYALVAVGLTLTWGVMDIVNFAHGEMLLWGMYAAFWIWCLVGLDPVLSLPVVMLLILSLIHISPPAAPIRSATSDSTAA